MLDSAVTSAGTVKWWAGLPGADALRAPAQREVCVRRPAREWASQPAPLPLSTLISNQINASPLIQAGLSPLFSLKKTNFSPHRAAATPPEPPERKKRGSTAPNHSAPSSLCPGRKPPHGHKKAVEERKSYLSTQRCPRVEVVGYPQHPQHSKAQQYPWFPPHGCLVFASARPCVRFAAPPARLSFRLWAAACPGLLCPCRALRRAASAGFVSRSGGAERAGSSKQTSARLEGKG